MRPGSIEGGDVPRHFICARGGSLKELSIFIDESGDFGEYDYHSPYYIIAMVFHNQSTDISSPLAKLEQDLTNRGFPHHCVHTGPIIRRENEYTYVSIDERRRIFNSMITFIKHIDMKYHCVHIEKKHVEDSVQAVAMLSKQISFFIKEHYTDFLDFDSVKIYYDNGQVEITKLLASVFTILLPSVEMRKVIPSDYRLFQVADLLCSLELVKLKIEASAVSASEMEFFGSLRDLKKNYLKPLALKEWI